MPTIVGKTICHFCRYCPPIYKWKYFKLVQKTLTKQTAKQQEHPKTNSENKDY